MHADPAELSSRLGERLAVWRGNARIESLEPLAGGRSSLTYRVDLGPERIVIELAPENVRVPAGNLLGRRGQGFRLGQTRLGAGRIFHAMRFLGSAQRAFDLMCARAVRRRAFGSLLADKQLIRKMVFDTAAEIRSCRPIVLEAAGRMDRGDDARVEVGMAKVLTAQMFQNAVDRAIQVRDAAGVTGDFPLERMFRYASQGRIWGGPDETHIDSVARQLIRPYRDAAAAAGEIPEE